MRDFDYLFVLSGTLGCVGSTIVIMTHILLPSMRTHSRKLLVWLSLCDLGQGLFFAGCVLACSLLSLCLGVGWKWLWWTTEDDPAQLGLPATSYQLQAAQAYARALLRSKGTQPAICN